MLYSVRHINLFSVIIGYTNGSMQLENAIPCPKSLLRCHNRKAPLFCDL